MIAIEENSKCDNCGRVSDYTAEVDFGGAGATTCLCESCVEDMVDTLLDTAAAIQRRRRKDAEGK